MKDNEIIKALECCAVMYDCHDCPFECDCGNVGNLSTAAIDLINRLNERDKKNERIIELDNKLIKTQSAEIERLKNSFDAQASLIEKKSLAYDRICVKHRNEINTAKSEAIKEFADRFKCNASVLCDKVTGLPCSYTISNYNFNLLLKEMVGDDNG